MIHTRRTLERWPAQRRRKTSRAPNRTRIERGNQSGSATPPPHPLVPTRHRKLARANPETGAFCLPRSCRSFFSAHDSGALLGAAAVVVVEPHNVVFTKIGA